MMSSAFCAFFSKVGSYGDSRMLPSPSKRRSVSKMAAVKINGTLATFSLSSSYPHEPSYSLKATSVEVVDETVAPSKFDKVHAGRVYDFFYNATVVRLWPEKDGRHLRESR